MPIPAIVQGIISARNSKKGTKVRHFVWASEDELKGMKRTRETQMRLMHWRSFITKAHLVQQEQQQRQGTSAISYAHQGIHVSADLGRIHRGALGLTTGTSS